MHKTKFIWTKNGQVHAITFPGEPGDNKFGTLAGEVPVDIKVGVGDIYPPKAVPAPVKKVTK